MALRTPSPASCWTPTGSGFTLQQCNCNVPEKYNGVYASLYWIRDVFWLGLPAPNGLHDDGLCVHTRVTHAVRTRRCVQVRTAGSYTGRIGRLCFGHACPSASALHHHQVPCQLHRGEYSSSATSSSTRVYTSPLGCACVYAFAPTCQLSGDRSH